VSYSNQIEYRLQPNNLDYRNRYFLIGNREWADAVDFSIRAGSNLNWNSLTRSDIRTFSAALHRAISNGAVKTKEQRASLDRLLSWLSLYGQGGFVVHKTPQKYRG
jgi:hypothetical protein